MNKGCLANGPSIQLFTNTPNSKDPEKMKSHNNAKTKIDETRDEIILNRRQKLD